MRQLNASYGTNLEFVHDTETLVQQKKLFEKLKAEYFTEGNDVISFIESKISQLHARDAYVKYYKKLEETFKTTFSQFKKTENNLQLYQADLKDFFYSVSKKISDAHVTLTSLDGTPTLEVVLIAKEEISYRELEYFLYRHGVIQLFQQGQDVKGDFQAKEKLSIFKLTGPLA